MLVLHRADGRIEHRQFSDFPNFLRPEDLVVLNDSRVIRARVFSDDGRVELLLLDQSSPLRWRCMVKPGRRMRLGAKCVAGGVHLRVVDILPAGERMIELDRPLDLEKFGKLPIPPYMKRESDSADDTRYQTVFAGPPGSVAAPTAGLHFTPDLLGSIPHAFVTLHVGTGTFAPVKAEFLSDHRMHEERYTIPDETAAAINRARRVIAVGTTVTRVLESQPSGPIRPISRATDIFIHPPFRFQRIGALLTNFHLPKSSLLMLVCAFAGHDHALAAYREAIREHYRFYSYGDCMLVL